MITVNPDVKELMDWRKSGRLKIDSKIQALLDKAEFKTIDMGTGHPNQPMFKQSADAIAGLVQNRDLKYMSPAGYESLNIETAKLLNNIVAKPDYYNQNDVLYSVNSTHMYSTAHRVLTRPEDRITHMIQGANYNAYVPSILYAGGDYVFNAGKPQDNWKDTRENSLKLATKFKSTMASFTIQTGNPESIDLNSDQFKSTIEVVNEITHLTNGQAGILIDKPYDFVGAKKLEGIVSYLSEGAQANVISMSSSSKLYKITSSFSVAATKNEILKEAQIAAASASVLSANPMGIAGAEAVIPVMNKDLDIIRGVNEGNIELLGDLMQANSKDYKEQMFLQEGIKGLFESYGIDPDSAFAFEHDTGLYVNLLANSPHTEGKKLGDYVIPQGAKTNDGTSIVEILGGDKINDDTKLRKFFEVVMPLTDAKTKIIGRSLSGSGVPEELGGYRFRVTGDREDHVNFLKSFEQGLQALGMQKVKAFDYVKKAEDYANKRTSQTFGVNPNPELANLAQKVAAKIETQKKL